MDSDAIFPVALFSAIAVLSILDAFYIPVEQKRKKSTYTAGMSL